MSEQAMVDQPEDAVPERAARRQRSFDILSTRGPRRAGALLTVLAAGPAGLVTVPQAGLAPLAGLVLVAVLAPLWVRPAAARGLVAASVVGAAAVAAPVLPPELPYVAGAVAALAALLVCCELVSQCTSRALEAQAATLRERAHRERELQKAAAEHVELAGELQHRATHDALTGLLNRAALSRYLDQLLAAGEPVGVLVAGLAGFTAINDVLGDELGDEALMTIGRRLAGAARGGDCVARLGGDQLSLIHI